PWRPKAIAWSSRELTLECEASDCWDGLWDPAEWPEATCLRLMDSFFKLQSPTIRWPPSGISLPATNNIGSSISPGLWAPGACKRESGERLWCGSCHDPHGEPEPLKRIDFYRSRCQRCHELSACKENLATRRKAQDDCIACHMPKGQVRDTEHAVFTDHTIPRSRQRW